MRLSIEIGRQDQVPDSNGLTDGVSAEIYLDPAGRDELIRELAVLSESNDHFHLFSISWGGHGLTEERRDQNSLICRGLKVHLRPEGEALWEPEKS